MTATSSFRAGMLSSLVLVMATVVWAQSTPQSDPSGTPPSTTQTTAPAPSAQPTPGTTPVQGDTPAAPPTKDSASAPAQSGDCVAPPSDKSAKKDKHSKDTQSKPSTVPCPEPGTTPVAGDVPAGTTVNPDKVVEVGSQKVNVKPGSVDDVSAVGNRDIGGRGMGNWYSTDSEIKMGKGYAAEIEKSTRFITDPVVTEYVNRIGQNIVKNSDCKVPFTIKVIDSDEVNAMALPGGFFYVNSGLILNADEEAELAGVMAHETAHVCAHHAAREMTRMNYVQLGSIPSDHDDGLQLDRLRNLRSLAIRHTHYIPEVLP